jgi:hypothetical protein
VASAQTDRQRQTDRQTDTDTDTQTQTETHRHTDTFNPWMWGSANAHKWNPLNFLNPRSRAGARALGKAGGAGPGPARRMRRGRVLPGAVNGCRIGSVSLRIAPQSHRPREEIGEGWDGATPVADKGVMPGDSKRKARLQGQLEQEERWWARASPE